MATLTANLPYDTSTAANYKAIMQQFGTALSTFGWIQTADTGQVSWAGVSTLPGNGVFRDWEIWRMNDTAQATMPVFMKLEYSTQGTNAPQFRVTMGTGSNGSGTITGTIVLNAQTITMNQSTSVGSGNLFPCYYSGTSGGIRMFLFGNTNGELDVNIERSRDVNGNDTDEYASITFINWAAGGIFSNFLTKTGLTGTSTRCGAFFGSALTNNVGGTTGACPLFVMPGKLGNPLMGMCFVPAGDVGQGATVSVNIYGATHTYLATKTIINGAGPNAANGYTGGAVLIRFE